MDWGAYFDRLAAERGEASAAVAGPTDVAAPSMRDVDDRWLEEIFRTVDRFGPIAGN